MILLTAKQTQPRYYGWREILLFIILGVVNYFATNILHIFGYNQGFLIGNLFVCVSGVFTVLVTRARYERKLKPHPLFKVAEIICYIIGIVMTIGGFILACTPLS